MHLNNQLHKTTYRPGAGHALLQIHFPYDKKTAPSLPVRFFI